MCIPGLISPIVGGSKITFFLVFPDSTKFFHTSKCSRKLLTPFIWTKILSAFMWCQYFNGIIKNSLSIAVFLKVGSKDMTLVPICFSNINQIHSNSECSRWQSIALLWTKIFPASMWCQYFYCAIKNTLSIAVLLKVGSTDMTCWDLFLFTM